MDSPSTPPDSLEAPHVLTLGKGQNEGDDGQHCNISMNSTRSEKVVTYAAAEILSKPLQEI